MAIIAGEPVVKTLTPAWRTWRITVFAEKELATANRYVVWNREPVMQDQDGVYHADTTGERGMLELRKTNAELQADTVTLASGAVLSGAQIAEALQLFGDRYHQEKIDTEAEEQEPDE